MNIEPSIIEFIKFGRLGRISIGSSIEDVDRIFGHGKLQERWAESGDLKVNALVFNDLYFGISKSTGMIGYIGASPQRKLGLRLGDYRFSDYPVHKRMFEDDFEQIINSHYIEPVSKVSWDDCGWCYEFESGVQVWFEGYSGSEPYLSEICIAKH